MSTTANAEPTIDHSAAIRSEVEADVRRLIERCNADIRGWWNEGERLLNGASPGPRYLKLGYTVAMHRGQDLYRDGDVVAGLRVSIDRHANRSITVYGDYVWLETERWDEVEGDTRTTEIERRVCETTTW